MLTPTRLRGRTPSSLQRIMGDRVPRVLTIVYWVWGGIESDGYTTDAAPL